MNKIKIFAIAIITVTTISCNQKQTQNKPIKSDIDKVSYLMGLDMGLNFRARFSEIDKDLFVKGFYNGIDSTDVKYTKEETDKILRAYFTEKNQKEMEKKNAERIKKLEENFKEVKEAGIKFLAENKNKKGVKVTKSGLQYLVIKEGKGEKPKANSKVTVHYHGTTPEGKTFDSTKDKKPIEFFLNQVIPGWTEGLQLMNKGAKYKFFIPQELAYGANAPMGGQGEIKPFMPLIFEVELLNFTTQE